MRRARQQAIQLKQVDRTTRSGSYEPTPREIRRVCGEIQATWSPRERAKRSRNMGRRPFVIAFVSLTELNEAAREARRSRR